MSLDQKQRLQSRIRMSSHIYHIRASRRRRCPSVGNNKLRHETLQDFMLANNSSTIAMEIPIWLTEDEISGLEARYGIELAAGGAPRSITGHIDFLQVRNGAVHILDYKPDARTNRPIAQLAIYALALTVRVPSLISSTSSAPGSTKRSITSSSRARCSRSAKNEGPRKWGLRWFSAPLPA